MNKHKISLFSEGGLYQSTFEPLVKSFIEKKIFISYYSLDSNDDILKIKSKYLNTKYLGFKFLGYLRFAMIESDYLLLTTPNIGNHGYPLKKPKLVKNLVHIFHSIADISTYRKGALDFYDSIILAGEFQEKSIREIEKLRGLKKKQLLYLGVPYIDFLVKKRKNIYNSKKTILVGSSWGDKGLFKSYGIDFIKKLSKLNYKIIVRPHPHSLKFEKKFIEKCRSELIKFKDLKWDDSINPSDSMNCSDLLISDISSLRFDFLFVHKKPLITLDIKTREMIGYEREFLSKNWTDKSNYEIGPVISKNSIHLLDKQIIKLFKNFNKSKISDYRDKTLFNFGKACESITDYFLKKS